MSNDKGKEPHLSKEGCDAKLHTCCVNALNTHKLAKKEAYRTEIDSLSNACTDLLCHFNESLSLLIARMETVMRDAHNNELTDIDSQIKHLFNLRKQAPANTFSGEQEIIKLTNQITALEHRKTISIKDTIQKIVYESLELAIRVNGVQMPENFNLSQYEYKPDSSLTESSEHS